MSETMFYMTIALEEQILKHKYCNEVNKNE